MLPLSALKQPIFWFVSGILMSVADLIPGISGSTILLLLGVYSFLLKNASDVLAFPKTWKKASLSKAFSSINYSFFVSIFLGYILGILLFSKLIHFLLESFPSYLFSLFLGLSLASSVLILMRSFRPIFLIIGSFLGVGLVFFASHHSAFHTTEIPSWLFILSGFLGIIFMLIPGISGSYILLELGLYQPVLNAISSLQWLHLSFLFLGIVIGALSSINLLSFLLSRFGANITSLMAGLILSSSWVLYSKTPAYETHDVSSISLTLLLSSIGACIIIVPALLTHFQAKTQGD